jgi:large subunit ribosomal protein L29
MSAAELRELTDEELFDALVEAKEERFNLRFQVATNQLDNTARLKTVKKEIAQILTIIRERELSPSAGAEEGGVPVGAPAADAKETD